MNASPPVEKVLARLREMGRKVTTTARGWECKCPAHDDQTPSLGILQGDNGCAILSCQAGCTFEEIAAALGIPVKELFMPKDEPPPRRRSATPKKVHPTLDRAIGAAAWGIAHRLEIPQDQVELAGKWTYHNAAGKPVALVVRHNLPATEKDKRPKQFTPLHAQGAGWVLGDPEGLWPLYNLPAVIKAVAAGQRVWFTEGEKAADALVSVGLCATTTAHGAKSPHKTDLSPLAAVSELVISQDNDDAGRLYAADIAKRVLATAPLAKVRIVDLPDLPPKGDAVEFLADRAGFPDEAIAEELDTVAAGAKILENPTAITQPAPSAEEPLALDPQDPLAAARAFLAARCTGADGSPTLLRYEETWYRWHHGQYHELKNEPLKSEIYQFLDTAVRADGSGFKPTKRLVEGVIDALVGLRCVAVTMPCWLDDKPGRPDPWELVSCRSSLLHVPTRKRLEPTPMLFTLSAVPFEYNPAAPAPAAWLAFLHEIFEGEDVQESIDFLQEWFGYCLLPDTSQQKILLIVGAKRSGKGTISRVLEGLIGKRNYAGPSLSSLARPFGLASLAEKWVACFPDVRFGGAGYDENTIIERLLSISGEDPIEVERKYKGSVTVKFPTRLIMLSNEMPRLQDSSAAIAGRFITLETRASFYGREDTTLQTRLLAELPSILNWSLDGLDRLRKRLRFSEPASSLVLKEELEDLSSPVAAFVRTRCKVGPSQECWVDDIYEEYKSWCEEEGRKPRPKNLFGRDLRSAVPSVRMERPRSENGGRLREYLGISVPGKYGYSAEPEKPSVGPHGSAPGPNGSPQENTGILSVGPHGLLTSPKKQKVIEKGGSRESTEEVSEGGDEAVVITSGISCGPPGPLSPDDLYANTEELEGGVL